MEETLISVLPKSFGFLYCRVMASAIHLMNPQLKNGYSLNRYTNLMVARRWPDRYKNTHCRDVTSIVNQYLRSAPGTKCTPGRVTCVYAARLDRCPTPNRPCCSLRKATEIFPLLTVGDRSNAWKREY